MFHCTKSKLSRAGAAQIELMLCVGLIVMLMLLAVANHSLQSKRQKVRHDSFFNAGSRATLPTYFRLPDLGLDSSRQPAFENLPESSLTQGFYRLPTRKNVVTESMSVSESIGSGTPRLHARISAAAALPSPAWTLKGWPDLGPSDDAEAARQWYDQAFETDLGDARDGLKLAE